MKYAIFIIFITSLSTAICFSTTLNDSISFSYCEYLAECEMISLLQERLCLGNSILTPYWLPSDDPIGQRCYMHLRKRYQMLDQLMRESNSLLLLCMAKHSESFNEDQKQQHCDHLLLEMVNVLRDNDGNPLLTKCFQGSKRSERQCGPLRQCCSAYDRCKELVKQSFITKQKQILIHEIQFAAKECKEGIYQLNNATESINKATISENSSTLITFTNQPDKDDLLESYLRHSPSQWHTFLKNILVKEAQNTSIFRGYDTVRYYGPKAGKNDDYYRILPNRTDEIEELNNTEHKNDIKEYQIGKKQEMHPKQTEEEYDGNYCDSYIKCRRKVEKTMDRCQMVWNSVNRIPLLSTATLLEMGDRCVSRGDNSFTELYKLAIERDSELHGCLKMYQDQTNELATCPDTNRIHWQWSSDILQNITSNADCLAQVNLVQFECAQLNKCCSNFHRCRDETLDAKSELRIELLTVKLIIKYHECIRHQLTTMATSSLISDKF